MIESCQPDKIIPPEESIEDIYYILGSERLVKEISFFKMEPECSLDLEYNLINESGEDLSDWPEMGI